VARELSILYGGSVSDRACACTGLDGVCVDCAAWWEMFLSTYKANQVENMMRLWQAARELTEHG